MINTKPSMPRMDPEREPPPRARSWARDDLTPPGEPPGAEPRQRGTLELASDDDLVTLDGARLDGEQEPDPWELAQGFDEETDPTPLFVTVRPHLDQSSDGAQRRQSQCDIQELDDGSLHELEQRGEPGDLVPLAQQPPPFPDESSHEEDLGLTVLPVVSVPAAPRPARPTQREPAASLPAASTPPPGAGRGRRRYGSARFRPVEESGWWRVALAAGAAVGLAGGVVWVLVL